jgi:hypothetical protein
VFPGGSRAWAESRGTSGRRPEIGPCSLRLNLLSLKSCGQKPLAHLAWGSPYGYNSHRSRLGRDNRPKLFRKTNISNDVAGALHPIVGRSGPDTVGLFTFLTLRATPQSFAK